MVTQRSATPVARTLVVVTPEPLSADHDLVIAFLNTVNIEEGTDVLDDPVSWRQWVRERRLGASGTPQRSRAARDALRAAVTHALDPALPSGDAPDATQGWRGVSLTAHLEAGMPTLTSADAVGAVLAAAVRLAVAGDWERVKICPADDCRWAFFDRSKNRSRTWCSMRVCGNRDKARNWRARARVT